MDQDRDLFLSEYIINYLQSIYPEIYGDDAVINNYVKYKYLIDKKRTEKLSDDEKQELEQLYIYFYGNSDGSSSASGASIAANYIKTINIIKDIIAKNDNAVKDSVKSIVEILSIDTPVSDEAFKKYINQVILPELIQNDEISYKINYKIKSENKVINPTITLSELKEKKKKEEEAKKAELAAKKAEEDAKKKAYIDANTTNKVLKETIKETIKTAAIDANKVATSNLNKASISFAETAKNEQNKLTTNKTFNQVIDKIIEIKDNNLICAIICNDFNKFKENLIIEIDSLIANDDNSKGTKYITSIQIKEYIHNEFKTIIDTKNDIIGIYNKYDSLPKNDERVIEFNKLKISYISNFEDKLKNAKKNLQDKYNIRINYNVLDEYIADVLNIDTIKKLKDFDIIMIYNLIINDLNDNIINFDDIFQNPLNKLYDLLQTIFIRSNINKNLINDINIFVKTKLETIKKENYLYNKIILSESLVTNCDCSKITHESHIKEIIDNLSKLNLAFNINNISDITKYSDLILKNLEKLRTMAKNKDSTAINTSTDNIPITKEVTDKLVKMSNVFIKKYSSLLTPAEQKQLDSITIVTVNDTINIALIVYYMKYDIITDIATIENDKDFCYYSIYITLLIPLLLKYLKNDGNQLDTYDNKLIYIIEEFLTELNSSNVNSKDLLDKINVEIQKQNTYYELNDLLKNSITLETEIEETLNDLDRILTNTGKKGGKKIKNKKYSRGGVGNIKLTEPIIDLFGKVSEIIYHIIFNINKYLITLIKYSTINKYNITSNLNVIKDKLDDLIKLFKKEYNIDYILDEILICLKDNQDFSHYLKTIVILNSSYNKILANSSLRSISAYIIAQKKIGTDNVNFIYIYYILYIFDNNYNIKINTLLNLQPYTYNSIKKILLETLLVPQLPPEAVAAVAAVARAVARAQVRPALSPAAPAAPLPPPALQPAPPAARAPPVPPAVEPAVAARAALSPAPPALSPAPPAPPALAPPAPPAVEPAAERAPPAALLARPQVRPPAPAPPPAPALELSPALLARPQVRPLAVIALPLPARAPPAALPAAKAPPARAPVRPALSPAPAPVEPLPALARVPARAAPPAALALDKIAEEYLNVQQREDPELLIVSKLADKLNILSGEAEKYDLNVGKCLLIYLLKVIDEIINILQTVNYEVQQVSLILEAYIIQIQQDNVLTNAQDAKNALIGMVRELITAVLTVNDASSKNLLIRVLNIAKPVLESELQKVEEDNPLYVVGGANIKIDEIYEIYYKYNIEESLYFINDLFKIIGNSELNIYILMLIFKVSFENQNDILKYIEVIFKDYLYIIKAQYEYLKSNDIILKNYYTNDEILYYVFINTIYANYKYLKEQSTDDIIFTIKIDDKEITIIENYHEIYKKLGKLFTDKEVIVKIIKYLKHYTLLESTDDKYETDDNYLLSYIYKYSKENSELITLNGYDEFITLMYLNLLNTLTNTIKLNETEHDISKLQTINIYDFSDLKKDYKVVLTEPTQENICNKIITDKSLLFILRDKYKTPEIQLNSNYRFTINADIIDIINSLNDRIISTDISLIDLKQYLKSYTPIKDDKKLILTDDNIIYNILRYSSYIFRDNNEISNNKYCKLIYCYIYLEKNNKQEDLIKLTYQLIYMMFMRTNKQINIKKLLECTKDILDKSISLTYINKFVKPVNTDEINRELIFKLLIDTYNLCKKSKKYESIYDIFIPYLLAFNNSELEIRVQNLLCEKVLNEMYSNIKGGNNSTEEKSALSQVYDNEKLNLLLPDEFIVKIDNSLNKLYLKINADIQNLDEITTNFDTILKLTISNNNKGVDFTKIDDYNNSDTFNTKMSGLVDMLKIQPDNKIDTTSAYSIKSKCESKKKDIEEFSKKYLTKDNLFNIKEIDGNLKELDDLFNTIKTNPELQLNPILKRIYNTYISPDEDVNSKNEYIVNPIIMAKELYETVIVNELAALKENSDIIKNKLDAIIKLVADLISSAEKGVGFNKQKIYVPTAVEPGQAVKVPTLGGELRRYNDIDKMNKPVDNKANLKLIKEKLTTSLLNIKTDMKRLKTSRTIKKDSEKHIAASGFIDNEGYNIFDKLIASYDADYNNKEISHEVTNNLFYSKVKSKNLDPAEELEVDLNDKLIFLVLAYFIRLGASYSCYYLIDNNIVTDIIYSLYYYIIFYLVIFLLIIVIVNFDTFKLRILLNYMNLHINTTELYLHAILMASFVYLIYLLVLNINGDEKPPIELSDPEKIKLKYKLDLLTIIIYVFICILIFII